MGLGLAVGLLASGTSTTWTPASLSPLVWLPSNTGQVTLVSGNVDSWNDASGNGFNAAFSGARPGYTSSDAGISGKPSVNFTGTQALVVPYNSALQTTNVALLIAWRWNSATRSGNHGIVANQTSGAWNDGWVLGEGPGAATDGEVEFYANAFNSNYTYNVFANTNWRATGASYNGAARPTYQNDGLTSGNIVGPGPSTNISFLGHTQIVVGGYTNSGGAGGALAGLVKADIAEIVIVGRALTAGELASWHTYCQTTFGTP